ncbi:MAG: YbaB/EbfC family nucleoid-associated protein [Cyclobacteriaceae bacterium]
MFDMTTMMNKVKEAQARIKETQEQLVHLRAEGEAGAGMVKVIVNGKRRVLDIEVDGSILNENDKEMMKDLIVAATNNALEQIDVKIKEKMASATAGMMPNIPGMDFGNMV